MGKKATSFLLYGLSILMTIILSVLIVIAANVDITISGSILSYFAGLLLPIAILLNLILLLYWLIRRRWIIAVIPLAALFGCYPYYGTFYQNGKTDASQASQTKEKSENLRILTYNTGNFLNKDNIRCARTLSNFMNSHLVDIACFQEYSMQGRFADSVQKVLNSYPYSISNATREGMRIAVYSKYPLLDTRYEAYPESDYGYIASTVALCNPAETAEAVATALLQHNLVPDTLQAHVSMRDSIITAVTRSLAESAPKMTLINTHLQSTGITTTQTEAAKLEKYGAEMENTEAARRMTTRMSESSKMRAQQIDILSEIIRNSPYPVILCGDFNDTPRSYVYNRASSLLLDGFKSGGSGYMYTYRYFKKILRIDYIFNSKEFKSVKYFSPEKEWSDHNPVISELERI